MEAIYGTDAGHFGREAHGHDCWGDRHGLPRNVAIVSKTVDDADDLHREQSRFCRSLRPHRPLDRCGNEWAYGCANHHRDLAASLAKVSLDLFCAYAGVSCRQSSHLARVAVVSRSRGNGFVDDWPYAKERA